MKHGTTGILASFTGLGISLSGVNEMLQFVSLIVGITVGLVSLVALLKNQNKKNKP